MISHNNKCVFVHIPKTAGQSIEMFFLNFYNLDWDTRYPLLLRPNNEPKLGPPRLAHLKLHEYLSYHYMSPDQFEEYYKFTFVSNPWSRAVSFYKYEGFNKFISFKKFVEKKLPELINKAGYFYGSQYSFIYNENQTTIDFIGRFENLNLDFGKICEKLEIPFTQLPHRNSSEEKRKRYNLKYYGKMFIKYPDSFFSKGGDQIKSRDYKDYYDSSLIRIIEELYHKDIEVFNYDFENTHYKK